MKLSKILLETVILFGIGIIILNGLIVYQDNIIRKQKILIQQLYKGHPCGEQR